MNPSNIFLKRGGTHYCLHDKVMQIRNDYGKEVFNGDIGIIVRVDTEDGELTVNFDDREVTYDVTELDELVLAYAKTIHKAQGSKYPIVVMPFTMSHYVMLQRNLLYTGVTRAKKILVLIGEKKAIACAVQNESTAARNTKLAERLRDMQETGETKASVSADPKVIQVGSRNKGAYLEIYQPEIFRVAEQQTPYGLNTLFNRLAQSKFRSSFALNANDRAFVQKKAWRPLLPIRGTS